MNRKLISNIKNRSFLNTVNAQIDALIVDMLEKLDTIGLRERFPTKNKDAYDFRFDDLYEALRSKDISHYKNRTVTWCHCFRTALIMSLILKEFNFGEDLKTILPFAVYLHDIGKGFVDFETINVPGKPDTKQWKAIQEHTFLGEELILRKTARTSRHIYKQPLITKKDNLFLRWVDAAINCAADHQERFDYSGYPKGKGPGEVHYYVRLLSIVDAFDAIIDKSRPYKEGETVSRTLDMLSEMGGKDFDPVLLDKFIAQVHKNRNVIRHIYRLFTPPPSQKNQ